MKQTIFILVCLTILANSCSTVKEDETQPPTVLQPLPDALTREQILDVADKYGLRDSIAIGYVSHKFQPFPPEAYPYLNAQYWEGFFLRWRKYLDKAAEQKMFDLQKSNIKTVQEYFNLIERFPLIRQSMVEAAGGEEAYNKDKQYTLSHKYHIYLGTTGVIALIPAEKDNGTYPGIRLDKGE